MDIEEHRKQTSKEEERGGQEEYKVLHLASKFFGFNLKAEMLKECRYLLCEREIVVGGRGGRDGLAGMWWWWGDGRKRTGS